IVAGRARTIAALHRGAGNGALLENATRSFLDPISEIRGGPRATGAAVHCRHASQRGEDRQIVALYCAKRGTEPLMCDFETSCLRNLRKPEPRVAVAELV